MNRLVARLLPFFEYDKSVFLRSGGTPAEIVEKRAKGLHALTRQALDSMPNTAAFSIALEARVPDLRMTEAYRMPFPYRNCIPVALRLGSVFEQACGEFVRDIDGRWRYDLQRPS